MNIKVAAFTVSEKSSNTHRKHKIGIMSECRPLVPLAAHRFIWLFDELTLCIGNMYHHLMNYFHAQLSMMFIMDINVKMPTSVGILTFISMINAPSESLKVRKVFIF